DAQLLLNHLLDSVNNGAQLPNRGAKPDTATAVGRLGICRDLVLPSVLMELCFIDNPTDLELLQNHRDRFAEGLADGLIEWSDQEPQKEHPEIQVKIADNLYENQGILARNNAYVPRDLVESHFEIPAEQLAKLPKIDYNKQVYLKAVDLQDFNIAVDWQSDPATVIFQQKYTNIGEIMGSGKATVEQLEQFLQKYHDEGCSPFPQLPRLYIEQAQAEGVNADVAFCQMCLETDYLRFGGIVEPHQHNFCGLGAVDSNTTGASFPDPETGVKAHIQHLKAYASNKKIKNPPIVDPRFEYVQRGVAVTVDDLSGRWATDPQYGQEIITILRRLYRII
ncbi:MAG: cell wall hydrolase, partial [Kamptonema sp. SIO4C4]|nr:cell wall hydrolase [Kamptonema sp. SIO4C4]